MITYICDYALVSPDILANKIMNDTRICTLVHWADIDEDTFELFVDFINFSTKGNDREIVESIIEPYLASLDNF